MKGEKATARNTARSAGPVAPDDHRKRLLGDNANISTPAASILLRFVRANDAIRTLRPPRVRRRSARDRRRLRSMNARSCRRSRIGLSNLLIEAMVARACHGGRPRRTASISWRAATTASSAPRRTPAVGSNVMPLVSRASRVGLLREPNSCLRSGDVRWWGARAVDGRRDDGIAAVVYGYTIRGRRRRSTAIAAADEFEIFARQFRCCECICLFDGAHLFLHFSWGLGRVNYWSAPGDTSRRRKLPRGSESDSLRVTGPPQRVVHRWRRLGDPAAHLADIVRCELARLFSSAEPKRFQSCCHLFGPFE